MYLIFWISYNNYIPCSSMSGTSIIKNPKILVGETVRSTAVGTLRMSHHCSQPHTQSLHFSRLQINLQLLERWKPSRLDEAKPYDNPPRMDADLRPTLAARLLLADDAPRPGIDGTRKQQATSARRSSGTWYRPLQQRRSSPS